MSNSDEEIIQEGIQSDIVEIEHNIMMGEALARLKKNKDFQTIITDGYLKDKALASVSLLAVPQIVERGQRSAVMEDLISASNLQYFFSQIENFYEVAQDQTAEIEQDIADLQAESDGGLGVH